MAAVGTVTRTKDLDGARAITYVYRWTSDAAGAVSGQALGVRAGYVEQMRIVPDSGGTQPTDQFDVTLVDENGLDLLAGQGANLTNTAPTNLAFNPGTYNVQKLDLVVANAGNAKSGYAYLTIGSQR